jgi:pyridoxine kinase
MVTPREVVLAEHRVVANPPNGTGDLAAALLLGRLMEGQTAEKALKATTAAVFEVVARAAKRGADELMLETDADSLVHPMAMVQTRRLVHPSGGRRA